MEKKQVKGVNMGDILIYALSTCVWCGKTKQLLKDMGVEYSYIDVDLLEGDEKKKIEDEMKKWNPRCSFPTLVINNKKCIVGYKEDEIRQELMK
jgi:glutaredoxin-like protein NrdH